MTRSRSRSSICTSFFTSPSSIFDTGMPVHLLTILAMSSSSTSSFSMRAPPSLPVPSCSAFSFFSSASSLGNSPYWICAARSSWPLRVCSSALEAQRLDLLLQLADAGDRVALLRPARTQRGRLLLAASPVRAPPLPAAPRLFASVSRFNAAFSISSDVACRSS